VELGLVITEKRIGQGRENAKQYLKNNPKIMEEVEKKVRDNFEKAFEKSLGDIEEFDNNEEDRAA
jgi:recombination protein RecA